MYGLPVNTRMSNDHPPQPPSPPIETQEVTHPEKYVIEFTGPYSFMVPNSFDEEHSEAAYSVVIDEIEAEIRFGGSQGGRSAFQGNGGASFPRDRHGLLLNQKIQVHFSKDYISDLPDDIEEPVYKDLMLGSRTAGLHKRLIYDSIRYYNRFIECYKVMTESYWMRSVNPNEIVNSTLRKVEDGEVIEETGIGLSGGMLHMGIITPQKDSNLRKNLQEDNDVTISRKLDLEIQDKIDLGEYTIAVIYSKQLFIFWTRREYKKMLLTMGRSGQQAKDRMWDNGRDQYDNIKTIYQNIDSDVGLEIKDSQEWELWVKYCYNLRNELVHEGRRANELDAIYAYYYTQKAMEDFKRRFRDAFN